MRERHSLEDEIKRLLHSIGQSHANQEEPRSPEEEAEPLLAGPEPERTEIIHVYVVREGEEEEEPGEYVVDSTLAAPEGEQSSSVDVDEPEFCLTAGDRRRISLDLLAARASVFLLLVCIACEVLLALTAPTPTITLVPLARDLSTTATITAVPGIPTGGQIAVRLLPSLTLSLVRTTLASGKGHQDAEAARGTITFYNGLFSSQTVEAGTLLTGSDGVEVVTDQTAVISAARASTPPIYGQVTVPAHAALAGPHGNIRVRDVNEACCLTSVLAQNTAAFQGGQNERDYTVVARADIDSIASSLTATLIKEEQAALASQLSAGEALVTPACRPEVTPDHRPGEEATTVKVTVTERCMAVAYESASLRDEAARAFTQQAVRLLGTHYRLVDAIWVRVVRTALRDNKGGIATISVHIGGTWAYRFSQHELERIKESIAGQTLRQARQVLLSLSGIRRVEIDGMGGNGRLPKGTSDFHMLLLFGEIPFERDG
jgi:hypothetical protein